MLRSVSRGRVLLTGETGFLGRRVRVRLDAEPGLAVVVLGKRLDELEPGELETFDTVIHLAAWTAKRAGTSDWERVVNANVDGLASLLRALDGTPRRLLFASTADVYGPHGGCGLREDSPLDPVNAYAASKLLGEHMVAEDACAWDYEACAIRIGHLYGPGEEAYEKLVPTAIRALMKGRPPTVVGNGQTRRDLLYVDDAAEAVRRLVIHPGELPRRLNLAAPDTHTLEEIANQLIEIVGFIGGIRYLSDHDDPPSLGFDTTLLSETIGEWERLPLGEGLRREIAHVVDLERGSSPSVRVRLKR
jgi:nucleoside-diphosphate-sugar epimerase